MKNKIGYVGLLGIPLALLGIVTSVAMADTAPVLAAPVATSIAAPSTTSDTDVETNDDAHDTGIEAKDATGADVETKDDADGPQEASDTEQAD